jgi:alkylhydroperoxidase family enzyme
MAAQEGRMCQKELSSLLVTIGAINVWNRLNAAIRQPADAA